MGDYRTRYAAVQRKVAALRAQKKAREEADAATKIAEEQAAIEKKAAEVKIIEDKAVVIGDRVKARVQMPHWKPRPLNIGDIGSIVSYEPGRRNGDRKYGPYKIKFGGVTGWLDADDFEKELAHNCTPTNIESYTCAKIKNEPVKELAHNCTPTNIESYDCAKIKDEPVKELAHHCTPTKIEFYNCANVKDQTVKEAIPPCRTYDQAEVYQKLPVIDWVHTQSAL